MPQHDLPIVCLLPSSPKIVTNNERYPLAKADEKTTQGYSWLIYTIFDFVRFDFAQHVLVPPLKFASEQLK